MLFDSNGVINIVFHGGLLLSTITINKLEGTSMTSNKNSIQVLKGLASSDSVKEILREMFYSIPVTPVSLGSVVYFGEKLISNEATRYQFYQKVFQISMPSIYFLAISTSILPYSVPMIQILKKDPLLTLKCLSANVAFVLFQNRAFEPLLGILKRFLISQYNVKRTIPSSLLYVLSLPAFSPFYSSLLQAVLLSPIKNIVRF